MHGVQATMGVTPLPGARPVARIDFGGGVRDPKSGFFEPHPP